LSIVVLPFTNLSSDPEQQYFADGITEDVTTDLSRIQNSFVISRNTAFSYRNKPVDTKQIGRELGVRYVLEGSVRRSSNRVRVSAQLIDAETDAHLWVDQFDSDIGDLLALQNEITSRIAITLNVELSRREAALPTNNPDAFDYILRGRAAYWKTGLQSRDLFAETLVLYERALALDPRSVEAQSQVANMLAIRAGNGWTESPVSDFRRAEELVEQALAASPRDYLAHYAKGSVLRFRGRCDQAIPEYERALESNPNWLNSLDFLAACKMMTGSMETAISLEQQAIRLGPRDPYIGNFYSRIGQAHLLLAQTDEAIIWFERAAGAIPGVRRPTRLSRLRLCSQRRDRARLRGACGSPQVGRRRSLLEHRTPQGRRNRRRARILGRAEGAGLVRSNLFRRLAQGRGARGMSADRLCCETSPQCVSKYRELFRSGVRLAGQCMNRIRRLAEILAPTSRDGLQNIHRLIRRAMATPTSA
jgi:TolB-like protein